MRWRRAAGALALTVAAVGCDGGDDEARIPAAQFAAETCDDLAPWGTAMDNAFATTRFDAAQQANGDLRARVDSRPAPAVDGGADVKESLLDAIDALDEALATKDEAEIADALAALDPIGGNPELRTAFSAAGACDDAFSSLP